MAKLFTVGGITRMAYHLQAIIGKQQALAQHASDFCHARVIPLAQGIALIPITDDLYDEIACAGEVEHFEKLSTGIEEWALRMSAVAPVAYIEAEFFGGIGGQSAVAWSGGSRVLGPIHSQDAINETLRFFGVRMDGAHDEFESVGLGRHRNTEDWMLEETKWIESGGGPLILVPQSVLSEWRGASLETPMQGDDYERACAVSGFLGEIQVGGSTALVLGDTPDRTTVISSELGPLLLRWGCADSEAAMLGAVRTGLGTAEIVELLKLRVTEPVYLLFDSAWSGNDFEDCLELRLEIGTYRVETRRHSQPRVEFLAHVFQKCSAHEI